jgi:hypothetical protein
VEIGIKQKSSMEGRIISKKNWRRNPEIGRNPKSSMEGRISNNKRR